MKHTMYFDNDDGTLFESQWTTKMIRSHIDWMLDDGDSKIPRYSVLSVTPTSTKTATEVVIQTAETTAVIHIGFAWGKYHAEPELAFEKWL